MAKEKGRKKAKQEGVEIDPSLRNLTRDHLYENPIKEIVIRPPEGKSMWWDVQPYVMDFMIQLLKGYLWECKYGHNMVAMHAEAREVERILNHLERLKKYEYGSVDADGNKVYEPEWWPTADEEFAILMVDFARLVPRMWD